MPDDAAPRVTAAGAILAIPKETCQRKAPTVRRSVQRQSGSISCRR
jgi:hypothetical protein